MEDKITIEQCRRRKDHLLKGYEQHNKQISGCMQILNHEIWDFRYRPNSENEDFKDLVDENRTKIQILQEQQRLLRKELEVIYEDKVLRFAPEEWKEKLFEEEKNENDRQSTV